MGLKRKPIPKPVLAAFNPYAYMLERMRRDRPNNLARLASDQLLSFPLEAYAAGETFKLANPGSLRFGVDWGAIKEQWPRPAQFVVDELANYGPQTSHVMFCSLDEPDPGTGATIDELRPLGSKEDESRGPQT